ncbi:MAG: TonB family protein [candidate division Zixibacteria bacterium]|nr:TonB family protein [candidate division Zixibacteria bacterium]
MRKYLVISFTAHLLILMGVILSSSAVTPKNAYPQIYRVNLVNASAPPPPRRVQKNPETQLLKKTPKQVVKSEPKPKGLTVQKQTKNPAKENRQNQKTAGAESKTNEQSNTRQKNYPDFLDDIDFGSEFGGIKIEGAEFQSSYYINLIFAKIRSRWVNPVRPSSVIQSIVYFRVDKNGKISNAEVEESSGVAAFDQSALRAVLTSDPLPPLPQEFSGDNIGIHLTFEYTP